MVREIVVRCDVCHHEGHALRDDPDAAAYVVTVLGSTWSLDLCDGHRAALIDPLADVAERLGQAVKGAETQRKRSGGVGGANPTAEPCLLCEHHSPTISALIVHLRVKHETTIRAVYGLTCPLCARDFPTASAVGGHISRSHRDVADFMGSASVPEAFRYAAEHGDDHGVVAKVLANHGRAALPARVKP